MINASSTFSHVDQNARRFGSRLVSMINASSTFSRCHHYGAHHKTGIQTSLDDQPIEHVQS